MLDLEPIKKRLGAFAPGKWRMGGPNVGTTLEDGVANVEFLMNAPGDIRKLVAEVERLREFEEVVPNMPEVSPEVQREFERWSAWDNRGDVGPFRE